jgi:integrase
MRNPNKHGSVYKLQGRRRNPWVARVTSGWKTAMAEKGKYAGQEVSRQKFFVIGYYPTKDKALTALALYRSGNLTPKSGITLKELYDEWSESKFPRIDKNTVKNYRGAWRRLSKLGHIPFTDLRTKHWQDIIDSTPLSISALKKMRTVISQLYKYAMQNDIVTTNYAQFIVLPKEDKKTKRIFTDIEIKRMEESDAQGIDTVLFLIYTGFRISEMLSLTRFNIDIENQIITGGSKTESGKNRIVPIHPKILPAVKKHLDRNGERLFCREDKKPMTDDKYRKSVYYPALDALGIERRTPHTCRHTFGSLLKRAGVDNIYIQRLMGHSNYSFTADVYTHPQVEELKCSIVKI